MESEVDCVILHLMEGKDDTTTTTFHVRRKSCDRSVLLVSLASAVDTDGDGLLDLMDVPGFDPSASSRVDSIFEDRGIENLDGADQLTNVQYLSMLCNQIRSIESGDFAGLDALQSIYLFGNEIASIELGAFSGLTNLATLILTTRQIAELDLNGVVFTQLGECDDYGGFCVDDPDGFASLILDGAALSSSSFDAIVATTC